MPEIRPFTGLVYDPTRAGPADRVTAPPYDVISPVDQDRFYRMSPYNVVRLILGKDEPGDDVSTNKYTRASSYLRSWTEQGILRPTPKPSVFPYELDFHLGGGRRRVRGLIVEVALEPWGGSIVPHERTFPGPIEDRLELIRAVRANLSPVYAVLSEAPEPPDLAAFLDEVTADLPDRETTDEAGTRHRLWIWDSTPERVTRPLEHRSMMMFVVDASAEDPPVLPIHRAVRGDSLPPFQGERVRDLAEVLATLRDEDLTYGTAHLAEGEVIHRVASLEGLPPTVCALHDRILDRASRLELRFVPDAVVAESLVSSGEATAAYLLPPTKVERVWEVVEKGGKLPQKSTYFWPKPRTGLVIRPLFA